MRGKWPFVGREQELDALRSWLDDTRVRGGVISGAAGVGKSRLAEQCLDEAEKSGMAVLRASATRSASEIPFGALAPLLPPSRPRDGDEAGGSAEMLRRLSEALIVRAGGRRLALVVDDAHLLDAASATLLHQIASAGAAFVLTTVRSGEPVPDAVVALWKEGICERLELGPLDPRVMETVLAAALSGPVDQATATQLIRQSQGNVLFLRELVLGALADGTLVSEEGIWRLVRPCTPSPRLTEIVRDRLGDLQPGETEFLELLSLGEPFGRAELELYGSEATVEQLDRKGLLRSRMHGRRLEIRLDHPLYGDVLRANISAHRLAALTRCLADGTQSAGGRRREDTLRIGTWRLNGGGGDPTTLLAAARAAHSRYDHALAERLARAALDAATGPTAGEEFDAALLAAQAASLQGRHLQAEAELVRIADRAGDDRQRALVALTRLDSLAFHLGRMEEGLLVAEEAEAAIVDPAWSGQLAARRGAVLLGTHGPGAAAAVYEQLLGTAGSTTTAWSAYLGGSYSHGRLGHAAAALAAAEQGLAAHETLGDPTDWGRWVHDWSRCRSLTWMGAFDDAESLALRQHHKAAADHAVEAQAWFAWALAELLTARGRIDDAIVRGREAAARFRALGRTVFVREALVHVALASAMGARVGEAASALATLDALDLPDLFYSAVDLGRAEAWATAAAGDLPGARRALVEAADTGGRRGDLVGEAAALHDVARLGGARSVALRLERVASHLEGDLSSAQTAHASALHQRDPAALDEVSRWFSDLGADIFAAEAAAQTAAEWRRSGNPTRAAAAERQARLLAARCPGARTPPLRMLHPGPHLTRAERDAAALAAQGRSNKEIARELHRSVRTVEGQLQRCYEKLGISRRADLPHALADQGFETASEPTARIGS